jgi:hypothetical protein
MKKAPRSANKAGVAQSDIPRDQSDGQNRSQSMNPRHGLRTLTQAPLEPHDMRNTGGLNHTHHSYYFTVRLPKMTVLEAQRCAMCYGTQQRLRDNIGEYSEAKETGSSMHKSANITYKMICLKKPLECEIIAHFFF